VLGEQASQQRPAVLAWGDDPPGAGPGGRPPGTPGAGPGGRPPGTPGAGPGGRPPGTPGAGPGGRPPGTPRWLKAPLLRHGALAPLAGA